MSLTSPTKEETAALVATVTRALPEDALEARMALGLLVGRLVQREAAIEVLRRELALDASARVRVVPVEVAPLLPGVATLVPAGLRLVKPEGA